MNNRYINNNQSLRIIQKILKNFDVEFLMFFYFSNKTMCEFNLENENLKSIQLNIRLTFADQPSNASAIDFCYKITQLP